MTDHASAIKLVSGTLATKKEERVNLSEITIDVFELIRTRRANSSNVTDSMVRTGTRLAPL